MRHHTAVVLSVALLLVCGADARQSITTFANVAAQGGSVAGRTGSAPYQAMPTVAGNATITLVNRAFDRGEGGGGGPSSITAQFAKFAGPVGDPAPTAYSGSESSGFGTSNTQGESLVSRSTNAPTYYTAGWGTSTTAPDSPSTPTSAVGGTYDPWTVTYDSVAALPGVTAGSTVDLYYQSTLFAFDATYGSTAVGAGPQGFANYLFQTYAENGSNTPLLLELGFDTEDGLAAQLFTTSEFDVYLLGANALDPNATPDDRTAGGTLLSGGDLTRLFAPLFGANGTPTQNLSFGFVRHVVVPPSDGSPFPFRWHTLTIATAQADPVPEPASLAALGVGTLALLRRRKRA